MGSNRTPMINSKINSKIPVATDEGLSPKLALSEGRSRRNIKSELEVRFELGEWNHLTIT